jgi:hypothetical protein
MISLRRLRAVLLLAIVSAIGWGIVGLLIAVGGNLLGGIGIRLGALVSVFGMFALFGFVAGAIYAVAIAMLPQREGQSGLSALRAGLMGVIGGLAVFLGLQVALVEGFSGTSLAVWAVFGLIGGATGVAIQRVAQRGALPASTDAPDSLKP